MSFWEKLFGSSPAPAAKPRQPKPATPEPPKPVAPAQPTNLVEEAKYIIRNSRGARDFYSRATQAGWTKIKEDFIGIYLQKGDATLIFGVLPSRGPDTIWTAMMKTKDTGTVDLITEGKIVIGGSPTPAAKSPQPKPTTPEPSKRAAPGQPADVGSGEERNISKPLSMALSKTLTDNRDGTVTDKATGLMWQKGEGGKHNWNAAMQYAKSLSLAGHSDWRLPSKVELLSLSRSLGEGSFNASRGKFEGESSSRGEIRKIYFPEMLSSEYWTLNTYPNGNTDAYYVDFTLAHPYLGSSSYAYKTYSYGVRCVRLTPITDLEEELDPDIYGLRRLSQNR